MKEAEPLELVFATHNQNKLKEVQALMPAHITLLSLNDIGCTEEIPETSPTIAGNAMQKAEYVKNKLGYDCFADDTGLEVEALDGEPGVHSARYAGPEKNDEANIEKLLHELEGIGDRRARFITVIAVNMASQELLFTGICSGRITTERTGQKGFGYDPIFQPADLSRTFGEMEMDEKASLSHRGKAIKKLRDYLSK